MNSLGSEEKKPVGYVMSGASTSNATFQLTKYGEERIYEGMLLIVKSRRNIDYLVRVENIKPYSEAFTEHSPFVIARREGLNVEFIEGIDKFYMVAESTILGEIGKHGLEEPHKPPLPGDAVYLFDMEQDLEKVYGVKPGDPGIIWIKSILGYQNLPLPLNIENITMHIGIFGVTGSGKSYATGVLIEKLSSIPTRAHDGKKIEVAIPTIVVDANADYLDYHEEFSKRGKLGAFNEVIRFVFKTASKRVLKAPFTEIIRISLSGFTPREIAELIMAYKTGGIGELPELQVSGLERTLTEIIKEYDNLTEVLTKRVYLVYDKLEELSSGKEAVIHYSTARAIRTAVDKFHQDIVEKMELLSEKPSIDENFIDWLVKNPSLIILDFSPEGAPGISQPIKQLVIAYLARLLFYKFTKYKLKGQEKYLLLLIEEAQNYIPSKSYPVSASVARSYLSLIATQGRKFGIILGLISQRPSFIDPVVVSMINTYFIFRISPEDVNYVMRLSGGLPEALRNRITRLSRGVAVIMGQMNMLGLPVIIKFEKRKVTHHMGSTHVMDTLTKTYTEKMKGHKT